MFKTSPFSVFFFCLVLGLASGTLGGALMGQYIVSYERSVLEVTTKDSARQLPSFLPSLPKELTLAEREDLLHSALVSVYASTDVNFRPATSLVDLVPLATGVVLTSDGWIAFLPHASAPLPSSVLVTVGQESYPLDRVVRDERTGVYFGKVASTHLPVLAFRDTFDLNLGEPLYFSSSPETFYSTSLSSISHPVRYSVDKLVRRLELSSGASVPSGSVVVDTSGGLVGLLITEKDHSAVLPVDSFLPAFRSLVKSSVITRPLFGWVVVDTDRLPPFAEEATAHTRSFLLVEQENKKATSPLRVGDRIVAIDQLPLSATRSLDDILLLYPSSQQLAITVTRPGESQPLTFTLPLSP